MSNNTFTEVKHTSWIGRIGSALAGVVIGLIMFIVAFPLLFWNEGRAVDRVKALNDGAAAVISIPSDQVNGENNSKLVHLTALADTEETLSDARFQVSAQALKLRRDVQIYQWQEETATRKEKKLGGGEKQTTEYTYSKTWSNELNDSSSFKQPEYSNPDTVAYKNRDIQAEKISFGAFTLPSSLVRKVNYFEKIDVSIDQSLELENGDIALPYQGGFYIGKDPAQPEIGDLRVTFSQVLPSEVSVVAEQTGSTFQKYTTDTGELLLLERGAVSAEAMFQTAKTENTMLTWALRVGGLFIMAFGLMLVLRPISVFADVIPLFGHLAESGIGVMSFLIASCLSFVTVSLAWIWFRPLIGGALLLVAIACVWMVRKRFKANDRSAAVEQAELASLKKESLTS